MSWGRTGGGWGLCGAGLRQHAPPGGLRGGWAVSPGTGVRDPLSAQSVSHSAPAAAPLPSPLPLALGSCGLSPAVPPLPPSGLSGVGGPQEDRALRVLELPGALAPGLPWGVGTGGGGAPVGVSVLQAATSPLPAWRAQPWRAPGCARRPAPCPSVPLGCPASSPSLASSAAGRLVAGVPRLGHPVGDAFAALSGPQGGRRVDRWGWVGPWLPRGSDGMLIGSGGVCHLSVCQPLGPGTRPGEVAATVTPCGCVHWGPDEGGGLPKVTLLVGTKPGPVTRPPVSPPPPPSRAVASSGRPARAPSPHQGDAPGPSRVTLGPAPPPAPRLHCRHLPGPVWSSRKPIHIPCPH